MSEPMERIALLERVVDALLPGDGLFPCASRVGVHIKLEERALAAGGPDFVARILGPLRDATQPMTERLIAFQEKRAADFDALLAIVYLSYYESLEVKDVIRSLGFAYNDRPQPDGLPLAAFDPANRYEKPTHRRGRFVPTDAVRRVDISALGNLMERVG